MRENRRRFLAAAGVERLVVMAPRQVHGADVMAVAADDAGVGQGVPRRRYRHRPARGGADGSGGGLRAGAPARPRTARDRRGPPAGGARPAIARNAVAVMRERFGCAPADIRAALGPGIGRCCYEVGPEVVTAVAARDAPAAGGPVRPAARRQGAARPVGGEHGAPGRGPAWRRSALPAPASAPAATWSASSRTGARAPLPAAAAP
ncbi:MAG: laccase domain-containing protein [Dehalococcoidia bacterium]